MPSGLGAGAAQQAGAVSCCIAAAWCTLLFLLCCVLFRARRSGYPMSPSIVEACLCAAASAL